MSSFNLNFYGIVVPQYKFAKKNKTDTVSTSVSDIKVKNNVALDTPSLNVED